MLQMCPEHKEPKPGREESVLLHLFHAGWRAPSKKAGLGKNPNHGEAKNIQKNK